MNAHCEMWEKLGHCEHSLKYMSHYCRKSCNLCDESSKKKTQKLIKNINKNNNQKNKVFIYSK